MFHHTEHVISAGELLKANFRFISYFIYKSWLGILSSPASVSCRWDYSVCRHTWLEIIFLAFLLSWFSVIAVDDAQDSKEKLSSRLPKEIIEPSMAVIAKIPAFRR